VFEIAENKKTDTQNEVSSQNGGPKIEGSDKETRRFSGRIMIVFVLIVGGIIALINSQANFTIGRKPEDPAKNYRAPQPSGFAELAGAMRRDRQPVQVIQVSPDVKENGPRRIVIESSGRTEVRPAPSPFPNYYSNKDDAQAASTLRTMRIQAITARPVVEDFKLEQNDSANGGTAQSGLGMVQAGQNSGSYAVDPAAMAALAQQGQAPDPNGQLEKQNFFRGDKGGGSFTPQGYSNNLPVPQQFPFELKAGAIIPGLLLTGINSDLPGNVIGQVSENVWDTATGKHVLIPKGTRILGVYDSEVTYGQRRVLLVWNRLVFPNGTTLNIAGSPGIDQAGYSGLSGKINEHWGTMFKSALLASIFVAGSEIVYDKDARAINENKSPRDIAGESLAGSILDMGTKIMNKASDIQPTITIRPGKKMGIFVQQDVVFPFPYF
jgi:type IV secretion system protein VirB10